MPVRMSCCYLDNDSNVAIVSSDVSSVHKGPFVLSVRDQDRCLYLIADNPDNQGKSVLAGFREFSELAKRMTSGVASESLWFALDSNGVFFEATPSGSDYYFSPVSAAYPGTTEAFMSKVSQEGFLLDINAIEVIQFFENKLRQAEVENA